MGEFILNGTLDCSVCNRASVTGTGAIVRTPAIVHCPNCKVDSILAEGEDALRLPTRTEFADICEDMEDCDLFDPKPTQSAIESCEAQQN